MASMSHSISIFVYLSIYMSSTCLAAARLSCLGPITTYPVGVTSPLQPPSCKGSYRYLPRDIYNCCQSSSCYHNQVPGWTTPQHHTSTKLDTGYGIWSWQEWKSLTHRESSGLNLVEFWTGVCPLAEIRVWGWCPSISSAGKTPSGRVDRYWKRA